MDIYKETADSRSKLKSHSRNMFPLPFPSSVNVCSFMCDAICNLPARCRPKEEWKAKNESCAGVSSLGCAWILPRAANPHQRRSKGCGECCVRWYIMGPRWWGGRETVTLEVPNCCAHERHLSRAWKRRWDGREGDRRHVGPVGGHHLQGLTTLPV